MILTRETKGLREKPVPVPLCPPQIQHGLPWDQTQASVMRSLQQTACAMAQLVCQDHVLSHCLKHF
jgi:hypothetical protein